ncbi:nmra-like family protein [Rutstroemia sp. NJR-2017a WRK4]|nr:nmra-like family protein [Rutstroemia sp. NJR-2017a WRK4]
MAVSTIVAVAGGSGKLGRAIVDGIKAAGQHKVLVLARESDDEKAKEIGAPIIAVDYSNPDAIASVLEQNNIDTVVSALSSMAPPEQEVNLITAADKSSVTKRYIPSIWAIKYTEEIASYFPLTAVKLNHLKTVKSTSLEWTAVLTGYFLDYYGAPKVKSYMPPMSLVIDVPNNSAAIPGDGNVPAVFTHTFDVGKFTAALLTKDKWEKETYIIGDKLTLNEFVRIAEEVKGTKFTVEYDTLDKLKIGQITELPSHPSSYVYFPKQMLQGMFAAFGVMFATGVFDFKPSRTLNDEFPEIKPKTARDIITEAYGA